MKRTRHSMLLRVLLLLVLPAAATAQTITDPFTNAASWGTPTTAPGKSISVGNGRMNYTSTTTADGGAMIPRNAPRLPTTNDWSLKVDAHIDSFTLTTQDQYVDVFLGVGKTGDWFDNNVLFEFCLGLWGVPSGYDIDGYVQINGVQAPPVFEIDGFNSPDVTLRMDYNAASHTVTYYCDTTGSADGYNWVAYGSANLASGTYNLNLVPTDTFTIILTGSSEFKTVTAGQAYLDNLEITIGAPPTAPTITTTSPLPAGTVGTPYSQTLTASGGTTPYTWAIASGNLPSGLSLSTAGVLSGTPTSTTTTNFSVKVTGTNGLSSTNAFSLTINPAPTSPVITTTSPLPAGTVGTPYSQTLTASGGTTPYTWAIASDNLPSGLSLSTAGVLSGTPASATTTNFSIKVTGNNGLSSTNAFSLTINPAPTAPTITTTSPLPVGSVGTPYSQTLTASGGTTPYTWAIASDNLPSGLSLSTAGVLSGTPTSATTTNFSVKVTGNNGLSSTNAFSLTINLAPPVLAISIVSNGACRLTLTGTPGWLYGIEYVTNLPASNTWQLLLTRMLTNATWVIDPGPAGTNQQRFYRAVLYPDRVLIPAGSFTMGDSLDGVSNELPLRSVYVSAFYMDKYEVTKALWDDVYNWAINHGYSFDRVASGKAANHPVQTVSWYDSVKWCNARSEKEGKTPAYYTDEGKTVVYRTGTNDLSTNKVNWGSGYRLPTEAEWEKAARGGLSGQRFPWGDTITHSNANYNSSTGYAYDVSPTRGWHPTFNDGVRPYTSPVGYFAANGYGLYDMVGNVWEWCWDWYGGAYTSGSQTDPRGSVSGSYRVVRGGGWYYFAFYCRTAFRNGVNYDPTSWDNSYIGFRSVLPSDQ